MDPKNRRQVLISFNIGLGFPFDFSPHCLTKRNLSFIINSRTAIAGAIIGLLLFFFLQFKEFELYWDAVFLRLEEEYRRSPFFNQFYWSDF